MNTDKRLLLWLAGSAFALVTLVAILAPNREDNDPRPTVTNAGSAGAKAAFLLLPQLGYKVERWDSPEEELDRVDAPSTTLIMADGVVDPNRQKITETAIQHFLERGGRVLDTGGATLLPNGKTVPPGWVQDKLQSRACETVPQGQGPFAQPGQLSTLDEGAWDEKASKLGMSLHIDQRCGNDAVVVHYPVGKGEAIWWSSSMPLSNAGLKDDSSLRLLLATAGAPGRTVLFDEFVHGPPIGFWDKAKGLPLTWLGVQLGLVALLLVLSFSRRNGPIRLPATIPRTSPVEFAESMGHLYQRAGATNAATSMARRRLLRFLHTDCGVPRHTLDEGPAAIAEALHERFSGDWSGLRKHLTDAAESESTRVTPNSALKLVQALDEDYDRLHAILSPHPTREIITSPPSVQHDAELVSAAKE